MLDSAGAPATERTYGGEMTMHIPLPAVWAKRLCDLPESGMGYQRVDVALKTGERVSGVSVLNAEFLVWLSERAPIDADAIADICLNQASVPDESVPDAD